MSKCECCSMAQKPGMMTSTRVKKFEKWDRAEEIEEETKYDGKMVCGYCIDTYVEEGYWPEHLDGRGAT